MPPYLAGLAGTSQRPYLRSSSQGAWMEEMRAHATEVCWRPIHVEDASLLRQPNEEDLMKYLKCTPNLVVSDVARSLKFYQETLGFEAGFTVPDGPPYVFGSVTSGAIEIFFNDRKAVAEEMPELAKEPIGGTMTLYIETDGVDGLYDRLAGMGVTIVSPLKTQFYGMREFTIADPDGWLVMFAQRVA
jgi:uncharacterized glyoxalase superfamily protein PhnB